MNKVSQTVIFLRNLAIGMMSPVLTLALLAHGADISTISLLLGAYSLTVILAEFPSGVFADVIGRKTAFMISVVLLLLSYGAFLLARSLAMLFFAMILSGLGRAFSSGSIDALVIDEAVRSGACLSGITAKIAILESSGLAAGALIGGLVSGLGERYAGNLTVNIAICAVLFLLTLLYIHEPPRARALRQKPGSRVTIAAQMRSGLLFMIGKGPARPLFVFAFAAGFALLSLETYWQPGFALAGPPQWMFGALSFAGFACVMIGSKLSEYFLTRFKDSGMALLLAMKALLGVGLILLAAQFIQAGFILVFLIIYVLIGGGSVAENTLLNRAVPSSQRAGVLSLFSFVLQLGGLAASAAGFFVSALSGFRAMWLIAGLMMIMSVSVYALIRLRRQRSAHTAQLSSGNENAAPGQE